MRVILTIGGGGPHVEIRLGPNRQKVGYPRFPISLTVTPPGSTDTPAQVRNKLESLTGDERLDASAIKGIAPGGATNLTNTPSATAVVINSSSQTGAGTTIASASASIAGVLTATLYSKLVGIEAGATVGANWNTNLSNIPAVISATTASFTTAQENKLAGIASGATVGATWGVNLSGIPSVISNTTASFTTTIESDITSLGITVASITTFLGTLGYFATGTDAANLTGTLSADRIADESLPLAKVTGLVTALASISTALGTKQATLVSGTNIKTINGATVLGSGDLAVTGGTKTLCKWIATEKGQPPASGFATLDTQNSVPYLAFADGVTSSTVFQDWIPQGANLGSGVDVTFTFAGSATSGGVRCDVAFESMVTAISSDSFDTATAGTATTGGTAWVPFSVTIRCTALDSLAAGGLFRVLVRRLGTDGADTYAATAGLLAVKIDQVA